MQQLFDAAGAVDAVDAVNQCPFQVGHLYQWAAFGGDDSLPANLVLIEMVIYIVEREGGDSGAARHHNLVEWLVGYAMKLQCGVVADVGGVGKAAANLKLVDCWLSGHGIYHAVKITTDLHGYALPLPSMQHARQHLRALVLCCGEFRQGKYAHLV